MNASPEAWSRIRKLICILVVAGLLTWVMLTLSGSSSPVAQAAFPVYAWSMVALALAYVADSVLRIVAERLPLPMLGERQP